MPAKIACFGRSECFVGDGDEEEDEEEEEDDDDVDEFEVKPEEARFLG